MNVDLGNPSFAACGKQEPGFLFCRDGVFPNSSSSLGLSLLGPCIHANFRIQRFSPQTSPVEHADGKIGFLVKDLAGRWAEDQRKERSTDYSDGQMGTEILTAE